MPARRPPRPSRPMAASISASARAHGAAPEAHVLRHGQVVVEAVAVAEQAHLGPDGAPVRRQVDAEHDGLAPAHRHEPGAQPQERGLAGAVRSLQQHDLAPLDPQGGAGQGREAAEHHHGVAEVDHRFHRPRPTVLTVRAARQCRRRPAGRSASDAPPTGDEPVAFARGERRGGPRRSGPQLARHHRPALPPAPGLALVGRPGRAGARRDRAAPAGLRRLPAVGHRASRPARPRTAWSSSSPTSLPDHHDHGRPPTTTTTTGAVRRTTTTAAPTTTPRAAAHHRCRPPSATPSPGWRRRPSGSTGSWCPAWASTSSRRARATTRTRPCPGQGGNVGIAGHRTTYGAPFFRIDELAPGDEVILTDARGGRYVYSVTDQFIVVAVAVRGAGAERRRRS